MAKPPPGSMTDRAATVAAAVLKKSSFPFLLLLIVVIFLVVQDRIDRNDPKLALAPVHADSELPFTPASPLTPGPTQENPHGQ